MRAAAHERTAKSPLGLRVLHAAVFLSIAAAAIALGQSELSQLSFALRQPFHFGEPPALWPLLGAALGAAAGAVILLSFARAKSAPLWASALTLAGLSMAYLGRVDGVARRTHHAANLDVLAAGRQLHRAQLEVLQRDGEIGRDEAFWDNALARLQLPLSPARTPSFARLPFDVVMLEEKGSPLSQRPGTLAVWVSRDGVEFEVHPIGFREDGSHGPLLDERASPVVLTGAFNPEAKAAAAPEPRDDARLP